MESGLILAVLVHVSAAIKHVIHDFTSTTINRNDQRCVTLGHFHRDEMLGRKLVHYFFYCLKVTMLD